MPVAEREQRELRDGAGEAFAAAFEMVVTPGIFGLLGWLLDARFGTFPVLTLCLAGTVLAYAVWKICRRFNADLDGALEARRARYPSACGDGETPGRAESAV